MLKKLALLSLCALLATVPAGTALSVPTAPSLVVADASSAAVGTVDYAFCGDPDVVAFAATDNGDGTWLFNFVDIGNPGCAWAEPGAAISADGSPETGFSGGVTSEAWTIAGDGSFTASLTVTLTLGNTISGAASGQTA